MASRKQIKYPTIADALYFRSKQILESNGILMPIEFDNGLQFKPKRTFFVYGVPDREPRGKHAHYTTKQIITCLNGQITAILNDGVRIEQYELRPGDSLFIPNLIWDEQIYHTPDSILFSLCSTHYDTNDYINDFDEFIQLKKNKTHE
jgi:UDP-2-acetamido-3-amino-2,3-dideoxy-glucuronate N-acetyltransferase